MSPSAPDTLRVACAVEGEGYVAHCAAMLHSLLVGNASSPVRVDYLHGADTSASGRAKLRSMVEAMGAEIVFQSVPDSWVRGLPTKDFTRKATWYRLFLPDLLPDAQRVIYLDADLLVLDSIGDFEVAVRESDEGLVELVARGEPLPVDGDPRAGI